MTFGQFLAILRARIWVALSVFVLVVGATVGVSLMLPKQYDGVASVVIDIKPDPVSAMAFQGMAMPSFMATQADILNSDRVALRVVRDLKLLDNPTLRQQWQEATQGQGAIEQWLIGQLMRNLDVKPSRESNVIQISYRSPDPRFAAGMANAFAQAYIATTLELRVDPARQFNAFFEVQTQEARKALTDAQAKLSAFQKANGIIAADERMDVENLRLAELSSQLVQLQALATESASRQAQAQGAQGDRTQEVLSNALISSLRVDLSRQEAKLQELNARFGDNHPQVQESRANIGELRRRIDSEVTRVTGGTSLTTNVNRQREAQVRRELEAQRLKLLQLKSVRDQQVVLQREVESAQRNFDNLNVRMTQTALEAENRQSYATQLSVAQAPADHSSPRVLLNTLLAVFVGSVLAISAALILELSNRRVRQREDVGAALGLPVLGVLPAPGAKRIKSGAGRSLLLNRPNVAGLPAP